jgi:hypothetical protein
LDKAVVVDKAVVATYPMVENRRKSVAPRHGIVGKEPARRGGEKYAGDGQTAFLKEEGNRTYDRGLNLFPLHQLTKVYGDNIERCLSMRQ